MGMSKLQIQKYLKKTGSPCPRPPRPPPAEPATAASLFRNRLRVFRGHGRLGAVTGGEANRHVWRGSFSCLKKPEPTFMPAAPRPLLPVARVLRGVPVLPLPTAMSFQTRRVTTTPVAVCGRTWLVRNTIGNTSGLRGARHCFKQLGPSRPPQIRVPRSPRSRMCLWSPSWGRRGASPGCSPRRAVGPGRPLSS